MAEFNLSKKIEELFEEDKDCFYHKKIRKDVKEFIEKLKEEYRISNKNINVWEEIIDKLAGKELTNG